ncbi:MAG TPA: polyphosphate kinase 1 [Candidatus Avidesulfovibrio excrementigallinarum]|nr:polyphosphate kinase 1 [Candidatus Avidesulfovibrio excrementigallinarum]
MSSKKTASYPEQICSPEEIKDLDCPNLYLNREINWLDFDAKVLEVAEEPHLPLLERLKFLSIFYNNLDEFFMVRVANVMRQYSSGAMTTSPDRISPSRSLTEIRRRTSLLLERAQNCWRKKLLPQLAERRVRLVRYRQLREKQRRFLEGYFRNEIYPILTPQAIDPGHPFPTISNTSINFIIQLYDARDGVYRFARLKCPSNVSRFIFVPQSKEAKNYASLGMDTGARDEDIVLLEDLIAEHLGDLFPGNEVVSAGLFRITRNTDVEIEEDEADDLLEAVKDLVDQRRFGNVVRLEIAHGMAVDLRKFLTAHLEVRPFQVYRIKGPLAFSEFIALYGLDRPRLKTPPIQSSMPAVFAEGNMYASLQKKDVLVYHPYESFSAVLEFLRRSSEDPGVVAIKQTLYRVGNDSPIVRALIEARRRGKQVTAVVELKARFDEERNINWAEEMEKEGVNVVYGLVGMKIHAKLCLVVRREADGVRRYVHIGTGNYNPSSAKMYTDMGLFTSNPDICADVTDLFNVMTGYAYRETYRQILVSPVSMRPTLLGLIEREITLHQQRGGGEIIFKCNQLVDREIIRTLYRASMAGVRIRLQVRGICCLRPGVPGISENISVTSIVGRFLEHSRLYWFNAGGEGCLYIGSADLMPRNLDRRIEVLTPILDPKLRRMLREDVLETHLCDNQQAWSLQSDATYRRLKPDSADKEINSQEIMIQRYAR